MTIEKEKKYVIDNPDLMAEWDWEKNDELGLDPSRLTINSSKKAYWICANHHHYSSRISHRNNGIKCPFCSGRYAIEGVDDLATTHPYLLAEWDYQKNQTPPNHYKAGSGAKVWWKCKWGHEYQARIYSRTSGTGCPTCNAQSQTSFSEQAIYYYAKQIDEKVVNRYKYDNKYEIDIFSPFLKAGVEYDSAYFHQVNSENDDKKDQYLKQHGIKLIRVRECRNTSDFSSKTNTINYIYKSDFDLEKVIEQVCVLLFGMCPNINIDRDRTFILELYYHEVQNNSLYEKYSTLANEWDYKRNGNLTPKMFLPKSHKKVWWICSKGHSFKAAIDSRTRGSSCPICSGQKVLSGYNDLLTVQKELCEEWDYDKNSLMPDQVSEHSGRSVWWKCRKCNFSWKASPATRVKAHGCPKCNQQKQISNFIKGKIERQGSFAYNFPQLLSEWDYEKNKGIDPYKLTNCSGLEVWWKCAQGHSWKSSVYSRTKKKTGCPYCAGRYAIEGVNDLQTVNPVLASEWDYSKNSIIPQNVMPNSGIKVWWHGKCGHRWEATVASRTHGNGCPYCAGKKVLKGYNDLATLYPNLCNEWNYPKNAPYTPDSFTKGSSKKVWWKCRKCGYEWEAIISNRTKGTGCPKCYRIRREIDE